MKTSGIVAALAGVSVTEAFLTAPLMGGRTSVTLQQRRSSCVQSRTGAGAARGQSMVSAATKEGTVAALPHGGTLVDLNVKTEAEKKVGQAEHPLHGKRCFRAVRTRTFADIAFAVCPVELYCCC